MSLQFDLALNEEVQGDVLQEALLENGKLLLWRNVLTWHYQCWTIRKHQTVWHSPVKLFHTIFSNFHVIPLFVISSCADLCIYRHLFMLSCRFYIRWCLLHNLPQEQAPHIFFSTFLPFGFLKHSCCCDRKSRAACAQSFAPWQQATIEITRRDQSIIACSRHACIFSFFAHFPFVVNHTINATPPWRLQQHPLLFATNHNDRTFFCVNAELSTTSTSWSQHHFVDVSLTL